MALALDRSNLIGKKYGRLTILHFFRKQSSRTRPFFRCRCDCGKEIEAASPDVLRGKHRSCGCLQIEAITKHGHSSFDPRKQSPTYRSWLSMKQRCLNPRATHYHRYGGRGIKLCDRWQNFVNFLSDMGVRPSKKYTIERMNNDGNYEPSNCRWATRKEQSANRCNSRG